MTLEWIGGKRITPTYSYAHEAATRLLEAGATSGLICVPLLSLPCLFFLPRRSPAVLVSSSRIFEYLLDDRSAEILLLGCLVQYPDYKPALSCYGRLAARKVRNVPRCILLREPERKNQSFYRARNNSLEFLVSLVLGRGPDRSRGKSPPTSSPLWPVPPPDSTGALTTSA